MGIKFIVDGKKVDKIKFSLAREIIKELAITNNRGYAGKVRRAFNEFEREIVKIVSQNTPHNTEYEYRKSQDTVRIASPSSLRDSVINQDGPKDGELRQGWQRKGRTFSSENARVINISILNAMANNNEQAAMVLNMVEHGVKAHYVYPKPDWPVMVNQTRGNPEGETLEWGEVIYHPSRKKYPIGGNIFAPNSPGREELQAFANTINHLNSQLAKKYKLKKNKKVKIEDV